MKEIKINFCDFFRGFDKENNDITNILREKYKVIISDNPDYIFYSTSSTNYLDYNCVRIFFTGECIVPDFNLCDYAIGFDYMSYGDRYVRVPLYKLFHYRSKFLSLDDRIINSLVKTGFCSFVVSNDQGMPERKQMYEMLNDYKKVDSGGRYMNNIGGPIKDKFEFDMQHKFSIAFENCSHPGYTTEKIVEAFAAGCIPIYFGDPLIGKEFNTKSFVNVRDYGSLHEAVEEVIRIDKNDDLYKKMLEEPILNSPTDLADLKSFLYNIFDQPLSHARRRPHNTYLDARELEANVYKQYYKYLGHYLKRVKGFARRLKNNAL